MPYLLLLIDSQFPVPLQFRGDPSTKAGGLIPCTNLAMETDCIGATSAVRIPWAGRRRKCRATCLRGFDQLVRLEWLVIRVLVGLHGYSDISTYERFKATKIEDTLWSVGPRNSPRATVVRPGSSSTVTDPSE
ncbi:hypothetical protein CTAM01_01170 [Colletotrichum tamarilloi]|uniref:Uncharacterized protein n=1 Tax=Colletotrichum tamarilloi TaxID=1209934 RepID=A0ABQ9RTZ2_9PEZI|nr:uncharacterized protein CTAM01_01170 [Colletotrichum tamarilloi]KAI3549028.1 hypothetical protein CSPX01_02588 [Colletotrichum filicis]KAK1512240.1 hypothetical protein CTAM01_01170 [Colletotrichum tamarilloi]